MLPERTTLPYPYIAGFIDGEGCFSVSRYRDPRRDTTHYRAVLAIVNTNRAVLDAIRATIGAGAVNPLRHGNSRWATTFQYRVSGRALAKALPEIRPFLVVKTDAADLLTCFFQEFYRWPPLDPDALDAIVARCRVLNARGPKVRT